MPPKKKKESFLDELLGNIGAKVDKVAMAEAVVEQFGGMNGLAELLYAEYEAAPKGSTARATVLRSIVELVRNASDQVGRQDWEDDLSEDELKAAAAEALRGKL